MRTINISCVIGTRPEALKMIPVIEALQKIKYFTVRTVVTGQHRELLLKILKESNIRIDVNFDVMLPNQNLNQLTSNLLVCFDNYLTEYPCDLLVAQGDTTTTFTAALSAFYKKIPFAHIEAGLRTAHIANPFPEELNRRITTMLSTLHFCPTQYAADNLKREGIEKNVFVTGNTIIDTLLQCEKNIPCEQSNNKTILVTCHRRENFGQPILNICQALKKLVANNPEIEIVMPVHPNPNVKEVVEKELASINRISLCEPFDYIQLVTALKSCYLVLTDSGGLQEEAPSLHKPVLVLRNETERPEGIACGAALLVGTDTDNIVLQVEKLLQDEYSYQAMSLVDSPYGDGQASRRISQIISEFFVKEKNQVPLEVLY